MIKDVLQSIIRMLIQKSETYVELCDDGHYRLIDPNDGEEISAHYGATHAAASFIIWGKLTDNKDLYQKGVSLLTSILDRWEESIKLPAFHFDFNNLAISMVVDLVETPLAERIKKTILSTPDSNHDTINWLPMRWTVNRKRNEWTNSTQYLSNIERCKKTIAEATNADGGIEDRLPHGMSFNLQYDLATVAVLQYLRIQGEELDLSKELGFLLNCVAPDGDINYLGRGTNQVFAWGLWIYLLSSSCREKACEVAIDYLSKYLPSMLEHNNMMLNDWDGKEKYLWWDYHYASVYTAHCLLWLILAYRDMDKKAISPISPTSFETGVHIYRTENAFVSWFEGRTEYLAEKGPTIAAIWTKKQGIIFKGTFGPWQGPFGNKYIYEDVVIKNFCGLLGVKRNRDWSKNRYIHRLLPNLETETSLTFKPVFSSIDVSEKDDELQISFNNSTQSNCIFNIPSYSNQLEFSVFADDMVIPMACVSSMRNQYGWMWLFQSMNIKAKTVGIKLKSYKCQK